MKWEQPKLVDLADRHNALNAVGFSSIPSPMPIDITGNSCQNGSTDSLFCFTGASANVGTGNYTPPV
jgi:hypothetical protein